ncbi:hypothetical protein ABC347_16580 [Sphingomonas sp. 1P06PA]|uniref:hypothetical protein n=1 Tax=Sphingomonas sp. 1P06PA TaxID=554121 RepID=UPI0039A4C646
MSVLLAYAAFILLLALPFILLAMVGTAGMSGVGLLFNGLRNGAPLMIVGALALLAGAAMVGLVGWRWLGSWDVGPASLEAQQSDRMVIAPRPRTLLMTLGTDTRAAMAGMRGKTFDRIVGERRALPMPRPEPGQSSYAYWGEWFEGRLSDTLVCHRDDADPRACITFTALPARPPGHIFGFLNDYAPDRLSSRLYHHKGTQTTDLYHCSVQIRRARHPLLAMNFELGGGSQLAFDRLVICRADALARLAADLA